MTEDRLEPHILPRQRRALERVAGRLREERPAPDPEFRAWLDGRVSEWESARAGGGLAGWRLGAALYLGGAALLLLVAAVLAVS
jgi:hypothetical protein